MKTKEGTIRVGDIFLSRKKKMIVIKVDKKFRTCDLIEFQYGKCSEVIESDAVVYRMAYIKNLRDVS